MNRRPAVFLDRDGTLTEPRHYPDRPEHLVLSAGVGPPLRALQEHGFALVVVTNQSGVARGLFGEDALEAMHAHLRDLLAAEGVKLDAVLHCPHHVDGVVPRLSIACECRKPEPGMLLRAAADLELDLSASWMVGDFASDVEAGRRAGCRTARVTHGADPGPGAPADVVATSTSVALEAVRGAVTGQLTGRLADGRTIHLYADEPGHATVIEDGRVLPGLPPPSRLRWDALEDEWVISAPFRKGRALAADAGCPLCPSRDGAATEIPVAGYDVAVVENRYPPLRGDLGACEVVSFGSDHGTPLSRLPVARVRTVVGAWADRTRELNARPEVAQVVCFENRGAEIGASLAHPHGQIYAYPFEPARFARIRSAAEQARRRGDGCPGCRMIAEETAAGERLVLAGEHWIAFVPFAARWPYEILVFARRHVPDLPALTAAERDELAHVYRAVLGCLDRVAGEPLPYMALWAQAPARGAREHSHLHARIFSDRSSAAAVKRPAAGELGAGAFVSETEPERAAESLRAALRESGDVACG